MTASFDLDFVTFRCEHSKCGEIFEKSSKDLSDDDEVFCPRCGTAASMGDDKHIVATAPASGAAPLMQKATR